MARVLPKKKVIKRLKDIPTEAMPKDFQLFLNEAETILDSLKNEDAQAEEVQLSWNRDNGDTIILKSIIPREELEWYRKVQPTITSLSSLLPPRDIDLRKLSLEKKRELVILFEVLEQKIKSTIQIIKK